MMYPRKFRRLLAAALAVPLTALAALGLFYVVLLHYDYRAHEKLDHINNMVISAEQLQGLIGRQDALVRRYEITGGTSHENALPPLHALTRARLAGLQKMVRDDPAVEKVLQSLNDEYLLWLSWAQQTMAGKTYGLTLAKNDARGWAQMDAIHTTLRHLLQMEHAHRQWQETAIARFKRHTTEAIALSILFLGLLLATLTRQSLQTVSRRYRRALEEQQQASAELDRSREWLQITLESIGEGVLSCDPDGRVTFMNAAAARLTGWQATDAAGHSVHEIFRIADEVTGHAKENPAFLVSGRMPSESLHGESLLLARHGAEYMVDHTAAPIRTAQHEPAGAVLVFRDVTDRLRTERALQTSEKLAVAGRLAASIAHEIHNPLDAIANLHYLIETEDDPGLQHEHLALARQELARTIQITRTMLSLYRESDSPVPVTISELVQGVLLLLERRATQEKVTIDQTYEADCHIEGFPAELRQVMTNVLINAMDAAGAGGNIQVKVENMAAEELRGAGVQICVTDSGPGLSDDAVGRVFRPFFTTKGESGTGLGLWVSLGIVQKHGGHIRIFNSKDATLPGACVEIFLPMRVLQRPATSRAGAASTAVRATA